MGDLPLYPPILTFQATFFFAKGNSTKSKAEFINASRFLPTQSAERISTITTVQLTSPLL